jgi:hypothetical protein
VAFAGLFRAGYIGAGLAPPGCRRRFPIDRERGSPPYSGMPLTTAPSSGPRMKVAGAYVPVSTGGGELVGAAPDASLPASFRFGMANSADQVRERVRALLNGGADFIKVIATVAVLTRGTNPGVPEFTEEEIGAAVEQAPITGPSSRPMPMARREFKRAVRAGVRSIEHGSLMDDEDLAGGGHLERGPHRQRRARTEVARGCPPQECALPRRHEAHVIFVPSW